MSYFKAPKFVKDLVDSVIVIEGGYVNNEFDSGGATNFGITEAVARENGYKGDMKHLPLSLAQDIYTNKYYYKPKFNLIAEISEEITKELFDTGVNSGTKTPVVWLQQLLNVLNRQEKDYKDITEDGLIGGQTTTALKAYLDKRGRNGLEVLYNLLNCKQGSFYVDLATRREKDEEFIFGWALHRLDFM